MNAGDEAERSDGPRTAVELAYAPLDRRRVRRLVRRWWWAIAMLVLVAVWWPNRHEVWRKGLVMGWQWRLERVTFEGERVVYESDPAKASQLVAASPGEYSADGTGRAAWYPRAWRGFPWGEVAGSGDLSQWQDGLLFAGHLTDRSGVGRWVLVTLNGRPTAWRGRNALLGELGLHVFAMEREGLRSRALARPLPGLELEPLERTGLVRRVFAGRAVTDDPSSFEFEYEEEGGGRWEARVTLWGAKVTSMTRLPKR
jgi:hypothetical protein